MSTQGTLYEPVGVVASYSRPGKVYEIKRNVRTGIFSCNCPSWIFQKGPAELRKPCKHMKELGFLTCTGKMKKGA